MSKGKISGASKRTLPEPKAAILNTPFDAHGGPDGRAGTLLDFSVNSNPFGPPEALCDALQEVDVSSYPDPTSDRAKHVAMTKHARDLSEITFGNGTADLIHRLAACYLSRGTTALVATPTFGEYARAARLQGAEVVEVEVFGSWSDLVLTAAIENHRPTLVFVCHPNNPTGHAWTAPQLHDLAGVCAKQGALLVLDLAYLDLSDVPGTALPERAVHLYSLTKNFAVPGVRVGYVVAPAEVIRVLERCAPPWQTSAHAQAAAAWALSRRGEAFLSTSVPAVLAARKAFRAGLRALNIRIWETRTTFFLCEVGDARAFKREAERAGFRVRDASSFGLPRHIRLATRRPEENARFLAWLASSKGVTGG